MRFIFWLAAGLFGALSVLLLWATTRTLGTPAMYRFLSAGIGFAFIAVLWEVQRRNFAARDYVMRNDGTTLVVWLLMVAIIVIVGLVFAFTRSS